MTTKREKAMAAMPQVGFAFDEETHLYLLDGKPLTGVTTVLGVIAKPALIQWAADMAVGHLGWFKEMDDENSGLLLNRFNEVRGFTDLDQWFQLLNEARTQHAKRKKVAGDVGKYAHKWVENWINAKINGTVLPARDPIVGHMTDNFVKWADESKAKFIASEVRVYSRKYWYAGTFDFICEIDGKIVIGDIKTGGGIYPEHFFQMGGYDIAVREMQENEGLLINGQTINRTDTYLVLNLKKNGEFDKREYFNPVLNKDAFLAALTLYRAMETIKL